MFTLPAQPLSIWQLTLKSFQAFKAVFVKCLPFVLLLLLINILIIASVMILFGGVQNTLLFFISSAMTGANIGSLVLLILLFILLAFWINFSVILKVESILFDHNRSFGTILKLSLTRGLVALLSWLVVGIVIGICFVILLMVAYLISHSVGVVVGILCFLAEFYIIIKLIAWTNFIIIGISPRKALQQSVNITKGNWWRTFSFILLLGMIVVLIAFIFNVIAAAITHSGISVDSIAFTIGILVSLPVGFLLWFSILIWNIVARWLLINDLMLRKK
jgi:hypothetical protein